MVARKIDELREQLARQLRQADEAFDTGDKSRARYLRERHIPRTLKLIAYEKGSKS